MSPRGASLIGSQSLSATRWARTQHEAGLDFRQWESRLAPVRTALWYIQETMKAVMIGLAVAGLVFLIGAAV